MFEPLLAAALIHGCVVEKVHDGDTLTAFCPREGKLKVRLYCIDAPELAQSPWGQEAREALERLVGRQVSIEPVVRDHYGRTVAVLRNHRFPNINLEMVEGGWAAVYRRYCRDQAFYRAEAKARRLKRGIWQRSGLHQKPWEYRRRKRLAREESRWEKLFKTLREWLHDLFR